MTSATSSGRPGDPLGGCAPEISSSGSAEPVCIQPGATAAAVGIARTFQMA